MDESAQCLLMLFAPPSLEETLVDWLLEQPAIAGFSSVEAYGHGGRPTGMSLLEQVTGRQRRIQFLMHTEYATAQHLIEQMRSAFQGAGLHYMMVPVSDAGRL